MACSRHRIRNSSSRCRGYNGRRVDRRELSIYQVSRDGGRGDEVKGLRYKICCD